VNSRSNCSTHVSVCIKESATLDPLVADPESKNLKRRAQFASCLSDIQNVARRKLRQINRTAICSIYAFRAANRLNKLRTIHLCAKVCASTSQWPRDVNWSSGMPQ